jgi:predicted homoserine dehydrogenase-like protein
MPYQQVVREAAGRAPVRVAVLGAGMFGAGIVSHAAYVPALRVCAVADTDLQAARRAYRQAGVPESQVAACDDPRQAAAALEAGRSIITTNAHILLELPLDVVVEATGSAEAGADHAQAAIAHGKHVAMVTKETDAAVGPILKRRADAAGVVYTAVDGDQHGLLIGLVAWARMVGLEVLCGGKMLDAHLLVELNPPAILHYGRRLPLTPQDALDFAPFPGRLLDSAARRASRLGDIGGAKPWDLAELAIAANATGLVPDVPQTHCPACWAAEIPALLCPGELGGLLAGAGRIDAAQILRQPHEAGLGGGVFVVVRVRGEAMRQIMSPKGMICAPGGETAMLMHPHHLLGIEAIGTILAAALLRVPTGALEYLPRFDVVYRTTRPLAAGECVGGDHSPALSGEIVPSVRLAPASPVPAGLACGARLRHPIPASALVTGADIERPAGSILWALRDEQEKTFPPRQP